MEEKEKPDGYVAWHPDYGPDCSIWETKKNCWERIQYGLIPVTDLSKQLDWITRPVKLVFLDEPQRGMTVKEAK